MLEVNSGVNGTFRLTINLDQQSHDGSATVSSIAKVNSLDKSKGDWSLNIGEP